MRSKVFTVFVLFFFIFSGLSTIFAQEIEVDWASMKIDWEKYSKNLVKALQSDNPGLKHSAILRVIQSAESLKVSEARYELMHIFRSDQNPKVRQLALIALHKINDKWAMRFLSDNLKYEKDEGIRLLGSYCLHDYYYN
jgi:HEAT repeat protein